MYPGLFDSLLDLFFPQKPECPFCGASCSGEKMCAACRLLFEQYCQVPRCSRCGRIMGKSIIIATDELQLCKECRIHGWPFVLARALGPYEGVLRQAIHRFKYGGSRWLARPLAGLMAEEIKSGTIPAGFDLILPVPLARDKLCQRGFNQSALLAKEICAILKVPSNGHALVKKFETPAQAGLNKATRAVNLQNAFQVVDKSCFYGKDILIIDDVFTTGNTMSAVAATLIQSGARQVFGFTAATGRCL